MKHSVVSTAPTSEPITLTEAKSFLKLSSDYTDDDAFIVMTIRSARQWCEERTNRSFLYQVRTQYQDGFYNGVSLRTYNNGRNYSGCIELLAGPLLSVSGTTVNSVKYYDEDNVLQTMDASDYIVDSTGRIPRIYVIESWPTTYTRPNAVEISYNAGFGTTSSSIPGYFISAMLLYIAHCYENRVPEITGVNISRFEMGIERLLDMGTVYQNAL